MAVTNRRTFLGTAAGLAAGGLAQTGRRPNILWLSIEDTGPELGCYGDKHAITPAIDRLAAAGVRYTHAYTVAGVCAPSRSGIITGMYPSSLGSMHMRCQARLPEFVRCFPEYLRQAGYYCTNNQKTDYNFVHRKETWDASNRAAHWRNRRPGQPFFAVFNHEVTHESRITWRGAQYEEAVAALAPGQRQDPARVPLPPYHPDTPETRRDWANHYETITAVDYQIAARLKELQEAGLAEDTIVFFWGDHGNGLPRAKRWLYESGTHAPLIVHVPEKFRAPGQAKPGSVDHQLVSFLDLAPTVLNLAGVPAPDHFHGRAFLGANLTPPRQFIHGARDRMDERYDIIRAVRDNRYRYIRNHEPWKPYYQEMRTPEAGETMKALRRAHAEGRLPAAAALFMGPKPPEELYDTANDPHEIRNLAGRPEHAAALKRLRAEQERWALETGDLGLVPEPELFEREKALGSRHAILRQPGGEALMKRLRAVNTLAAAARPDVAALRPFARDADAAVRYWAAVGLGRAGAGRDLKGLVDDASPAVRVAAARGLADVDLLVRELDGPNDFARLQAVQALDEMGAAARPARARIARLEKEDSNDYVRRVAGHALGRLG
ncbi:MAG: sulfatase [Acidobacteria bacterium]|nr:sulfatase [Acidobacteriota bacterium]